MQLNEDEILDKASHFKENEDFGHLIGTLQKGIIDFPESRRINSLLGLFLVNQSRYEESLKYLEKAIGLGNQSELIHLGLYIAYVSTNQDKKAVDLLFKFLENNEADLFKDTLEELVEGLQDGYLTNYKEQILFFAKKNNANY